jgi:hypothetical protein
MRMNHDVVILFKVFPIPIQKKGGYSHPLRKEGLWQTQADELIKVVTQELAVELLEWLQCFLAVIMMEKLLGRLLTLRNPKDFENYSSHTSHIPTQRASMSRELYLVL